MPDQVAAPKLLPQLRHFPLLILLIMSAAHVIPLTTSLIAHVGSGHGTLIQLLGVLLTVATVVSTSIGITTWRTGVAFAVLGLLAVAVEGAAGGGTGTDASPAFAYTILASISFAVTLRLRAALLAAGTTLTLYVLTHQVLDPEDVRIAIDEVVQVAPAVIAISFATAMVVVGSHRADTARAERLEAEVDQARALSRIRARREAELKMHDVTIPALTSVTRESIPDVAAVRQACAEAAQAIRLGHDEV